jgi:hypothetical protein
VGSSVIYTYPDPLSLPDALPNLGGGTAVEDEIDDADTDELEWPPIR